MEKRRNSIANAPELCLLFCINSSVASGLGVNTMPADATAP